MKHHIVNISCFGNELALLDCQHSEDDNGDSACGNSNDAGVICQSSDVKYSNCTDYEVKLENSTSNEGKVLVCINKIWGVICSESLSSQTDEVICRQLGFSSHGSIMYNTEFDPSTNVALLTRIYCKGSEDSIEECNIASHYTKASSCGIHDIIGVKCQKCPEGELRLVPANTYSDNVGRVEVCINGTWGIICQKLFDDADASVICKNLGYSSYGSMFLNINTYYFHHQPHNIADLNCTGNEDSIWNCPHNILTDHTCSPASIACYEEELVTHSNCSKDEVRLSGGSTALSGRVEICHGNVWFGIISNYWAWYSNSASKTVCSSLGYHNQFATGSYGSYIDLPLLPLYPYRFNCGTGRKSLLHCSKYLMSYHSNPRYASSSCQQKCEDGKVRLSKITYTSQGRVELCKNGTWGGICRDDFDASDANVVCRQLGYFSYGSIVLNSYYSADIPVFISALNCSGSESSVWECAQNNSVNKYCYYLAAVACLEKNYSVTDCKDGDTRLASGLSKFQGRVEVCYNRIWSSVCSYSWNNKDGNVVCKELGYQSVGSIPHYSGYFGQGTGPVLVSNVYCSGSEDSILECSHNKQNALTYCSAYDSAGVTCIEPCKNNSIRLSGSTLEYAGRVEVCIGSEWTTLCHTSWGLNEAKVVCKELGFSKFGALPIYSCYHENELYFSISEINCTGNEEHLLNCSYNQTIPHDCAWNDDAGVMCQVYSDQENCTSGDVRLVGGSGTNEGRVEVCVNDAWGTICSSSWDNKDGQVVCRQLGFPILGVKTYYNAHFGPGSGPIFLSNLNCIGNEDNLLECSRYSCNVQSCSHSNDAGVFCELPCSPGDVRLGDGNILKGRVEVCVNGTWGTICDEHWTDSEATVVCSQLGYSKYGAMAMKHLYTNYEWPTLVYGLHCDGNESSIWECSSNSSGIGSICHKGYHYDASVYCMANTTKYSNCSNGEIRLVGGDTVNEGNVQICHRNAWGSICDDYWDTKDSNVVCRQLGFQPYGSAIYYNSHFSNVNPPFVYGGFHCVGTEKNLADCPWNSNVLQGCSISEVAGVHCEGVCTDGNVRLKGFNNDRLGQVEVCVNGSWSTICDKHWDDTDASVICRQSEFSSYGALAAYGSQVYYSDFPMRAYGVNCTGNEKNIFSCPIHLTSKGDEYMNCKSGVAGVFCQEQASTTQMCNGGDTVRLAGGQISTEGRVEVCVNGYWGTVCDDGWDVLDGNVVCKQLGFQPFGSKPRYWSAFGRGDVPMILAGVACTGSEETILDCKRNLYQIRYCYPSEVAGLQCEELCTDGDVRIHNGGNIGRVEVCSNKTWGAICDDSWSYNDARVVCRQLRYSPNGAIPGRNAFINNRIPISVQSLNCKGSEVTTQLCDIKYDAKSQCNVNSQAGVVCQDSKTIQESCENGRIRLCNGPSNTEGRVEVCINDVWGSVCDYQWGTADANVVCNQLGYYPTGAKPRYGAFYGESSGPVLLSHLNCGGNEKNILECDNDISSISHCHHYQDAGVKCQGSFPVYTSRSYSSILGGDIVFVSGPAFQQGDNITCIFGQVGSECAYLSNERCLCAVPEYSEEGVVQLTLEIKRNQAILTGATNFRFISPVTEDAEEDITISSETDYLSPGDAVNITWIPERISMGLFASDEAFVNVVMLLYSSDSDQWENEVILANNVRNSDGRVEVVIPEISELEPDITASQIRLSFSTRNGTENSRVKRAVPLIPIALAAAGRVLLRLAIRGIKWYVKKKIKEIRDNPYDAAKRVACEAWHLTADRVNTQNLPPCPCNRKQAKGDDRFEKQNLLHLIASKTFFKKKKAWSCYRQSSISDLGPSQQCCYNFFGDIITGVGGGAAYQVYPKDWKSTLKYLQTDVLPFYLCCHGKFAACQRYYNRRPNDDCSEYPERPPPARAFGDPHLVSLDGHKYTFNGKGEFIMVESLDGDLVVQSRFVELNSNNGSNKTAVGTGTVISAIAARHKYSDTVQFEISDNTLVALVNGDEINFDELFELEFKNLTVTRKANNTLFASLATGLSITVSATNNIIQDMTVTLSDKYYQNTRGLMGQYNGDTSDDLLPKNSTFPIPINSSVEDIHYMFGLTWIVDNPRSSLFTYGSSGSWNTFYKPAYTPLFEAKFSDASFEEEARKICGDDELCLFDVAATGDLTIGESTKMSQEQQETITNLFKPFKCDPPCDNGACVGNQTCVCSSGYDGDTCSDPVYDPCEENLCENGGTCVMQAEDYLCICAEGFEGPFCNSTTNNTTVNTDSTEEPKSEKSDLSIVIIGAVAIIGGIIMIALVMVVCALCFFRCKKKSTSQRRRTNEYHKNQPNMKFANEYEMK